MRRGKKPKVQPDSPKIVVRGKYACSITRGVLRLNQALPMEWDDDPVANFLIHQLIAEAFQRDLTLLGPIHFHRNDNMLLHMYGYSICAVRCPAIASEEWEALQRGEYLLPKPYAKGFEAYWRE